MFLRSLSRRAAASVDAAALARPVAFACCSQAAKTFITDVAVQRGVEGRHELDVQRTLAFTLFGFGWMGGAQYFIYVRFFDALLPARTTAAASAKVALDQFVYVPGLFFPVYYLVDAAVRDPRNDPAQLATDAAARYRREIWQTCVDTWPFSIAAQYVGFRFVSSHLLIPYVTCCSFVFTGLVSALQGRFREAERRVVEDVVERARSTTTTTAPIVVAA